MKFLKGKICLVTGGTRGIGKAIAIAMADAGADVAFNYLQSKETALQMCDQIAQKGVRVKAYQTNVADAVEVDKMAQAVLDDLGPTSIIVNCAGITRDKSFVNMAREQWDDVIAVNLGGPTPPKGPVR